MTSIAIDAKTAAPDVPVGRSLEERFFEKVCFGDGCWEWSGCRAPNGYGHIRVDGRAIPAHRAAYELFKGVIPDGLDIDHLCRNRGCVRPAHLEAVTRGENLRRGLPFRAPITHCPHGHEYDAANTSIGRDGRRRCRACNRAHKQRARA